MIRIFTFLVILLFCATLQSQIMEEWVARYNGTGNYNDVPYAMTVDLSGNIYVTGTTNTQSASFDFATIKYNSSGVQQWIATYNVIGHDAAFAITVDGSGNVYVTGSSQGGLGSDYATIKYNPSGIQQWVSRYESPSFGEDTPSAIAVDEAGNVYVTGYSENINTDMDFVTIKYDNNGNELWLQRYEGPGNSHDVASALVLDASGSIYVTGGAGFDYTTIKYNSSGVQQWIQTYNGPANGSDSPYGLAIDNEANIYITGMSWGGTNFDYATVKYNSSGVQQWVQRYNSPSNDNDYAYSIGVDGSGNIFVTGSSEGDFATIKYNSSGQQQWMQFYNGPSDSGDAASSLALDASGNVYITGYSFGGPVTVYNFATVKYNSSGNQMWVQNYNGPGNFYDLPRSIIVDGAGNIYITGQSGGAGTGLDFATIKYSDNPVPVELISFNAFSENNNVTLQWITGSEINNSGFEVERNQKSEDGIRTEWEKISFINGKGTTSESQTYSFTDKGLVPGYYLYRLKQIDYNGSYEYSEVLEVEIELPDEISLAQNYPNPFNPTTTITFSLPKSINIKLQVYNLLGEKITELFNGFKEAGTHIVEFNATEFNSGLYFYRIEAEGFDQSKKMILIK